MYQQAFPTQNNSFKQVIHLNIEQNQNALE